VSHIVQKLFLDHRISIAAVVAYRTDGFFQYFYY